MQTDLSGRADALILRIYDTVVDDQSWPDLLKDIASFCNARGGFIFTLDGPPDARVLRADQFSSNYDSGVISAYLAEHKREELKEPC